MRRASACFPFIGSEVTSPQITRSEGPQITARRPRKVSFSHRAHPQGVLITAGILESWGPKGRLALRPPPTH
jgi:hypothetical protein